MMRIRNQTASIGTLLAILLFALPGFAQVNGGFELPLVPVGSYTQFNFPGGFTGWTLVGMTGENVLIVSGSYTSGGVSFPAQSGNQWLDLTGGGSNQDDEGVKQRCGTIKGARYQLSYWVGNVTAFGGTSSTVNVKINGNTAYMDTNSMPSNNQLVWQQFTHTFTATTGTTTFTFLNGDPPGDNINGLDSIRITRNGHKLKCFKQLAMN